jgi:hypothetical protein
MDTAMESHQTFVSTSEANRLQAQCIVRFHVRLLRNGADVTREQAARIWIGRYARLWRGHAMRRGTAGRKSAPGHYPCQ